MPEWEIRFSEHPLFDQLSTAQTRIGNLGDVAVEVSTAASDDLNRLSHVVDRIGRRLENADPLAASSSHLNGIQQNLGKVNTELERFESNRNAQHLAQANSFAENALVQAGNLAAIESPADLEGIHETIVSFRRSLGLHLHHVKEQKDELASRLEDVEDELAERSAALERLGERIEERLTDFHSQFSQAENTRRQEAQQQIKEVQQKATQIEERFNTAQTERATRFEELVSERKEEWLGLRTEIADQRADMVAEFREELDGFREWMMVKKEEVEKLAGAIAQTGMVEGYQRVANNERWTMWIWQGITVASIGGFVWLMLASLPEVVAALPEGAEGIAADSSSWLFLVRRTLAALGLGGLAAFAGRQAHKHGENERRLRKMELEIASVGPFLATIPKTEQDAVKKLIAERAFGKGSEPIAAEDVTATTSGLLEIIRVLVDGLFKKLK